MDDVQDFVTKTKIDGWDHPRGPRRHRVHRRSPCGAQRDDAANQPRQRGAIGVGTSRRRRRQAPELRAAVEARASAKQTSTSEIIRQALRRFLEVA
jgi:hypothetical protein